MINKFSGVAEAAEKNDMIAYRTSIPCMVIVIQRRLMIPAMSK
jgi:hypothetical protein